VGKTSGRSIALFINNAPCPLTTVGVYEDGSIDCWDFVDRRLFENKLKTRWVLGLGDGSIAEHREANLTKKCIHFSSPKRRHPVAD
jgi:hypothetical protein